MKHAWTIAVALSVLGGRVWAQEHARDRESGGGHPASHEAAESRHPSPHGEHAPAASSSSSHGSEASSASSSDPVRDAQLRHPRAGTGTGGRRDGGYIRSYGGRSYYYPDLYLGYYGGYGWPYYGGGYYGYGYGYPYGYGYGNGNGYAYRPYSRYYRDSGSLRILVDPPRTRVYVDSYYAGIADDFDGLFQRLHVAPGRHEIMLRLEGYRTHRFMVYVPYDHTVKIHHQMLQGEGEDPPEEMMSGPTGYVAESGSYGRREPAPYYGRDERNAGDAGQLRLDVRPSDASIYIDGEFRGTARDHDRLSLPPGMHRVEVVRPGFRTVERDVEVRPGRTTEMEVELVR